MKLALIIGGSRGLGLALLEQYRAAGWVVYEFSRSGTGEGHIDLDLASDDLAEYTQLIDQLAAQAWREVVLVCNSASILPIKPLAQMDAQDLAQALQTNFTQPIRLIHAFVVAFAPHPARKVVAQVSSGAAQRAIASWSSYCASKAGLDHFMAVLALEQSRASKPITAIVLDPGVMDTAMQATLRACSAADFPDHAQFVARQQQGLLRAPATVAQFCIAAIARAEQGARYDIDG